MSAWLALISCWGTAVHVAAAGEDLGSARIAEPLGRPVPRAIKLRADVSHLAALYEGGRWVSFTDLRLAGQNHPDHPSPWLWRVDARQRVPSDDDTALRGDVTELYAGGRLGDFRLTLGRHLVRPLARAEVDGAMIGYRVTEALEGLVFGGMVPDPFSGAIDPRAIGGGLGYEYLTMNANHAGGAAALLFEGGLDRCWVSQRSIVKLGPPWTLILAGVVDVLSQHDTMVKNEAGLDLTMGEAMIRYRPVDWYDSALVGVHNHTIIPLRWYQDWLERRQRAIAFELDGPEPAGTRITSWRWTNNVHIGRVLSPYVLGRWDWRHNDERSGWEGRLGVKLLHPWGYGDASYAFRRRFGDSMHVGHARLAVDEPIWGVDAGVAIIRSLSHAPGQLGRSISVDGQAWLTLDQILFGAGGMQLVVQYVLMREGAAVVQTGMVMVGYRY